MYNQVEAPVVASVERYVADDVEFVRLSETRTQESPGPPPPALGLGAQLVTVSVLVAGPDAVLIADDERAPEIR